MKLRNVMAYGLVSLTVVFAGCDTNSGNSSISAPGASESGAGPVEILIQAANPNNPTQIASFNDKLARYKAAYPNVTVNTTDWQYNPNEIGIKMASGQAPSVYAAFATDGNFLAGKGWIADLTNILKSYTHKDDFNPILTSAYTIGDKVYGIPDYGYVIGVTINKKLLADKGIALPSMDWTWDDFANIAKQVSDKAKGIAGIAVLGKGNEAGWGFTNFLYEAGGDVQAVADGKVTATFNGAAGKQALDFFKKLQWDDRAFPISWTLDWAGATGAFTQGRAAMVYVGPTDAVTAALNNGNWKVDDFAAYPMPAAQAGGQHVGILGGNSYVINANATAEQQQAAFDWITFDYFSDQGIKAQEALVKQQKDEGKFFVQGQLSYYRSDSDYAKKIDAIYAKYDNVWKYDPQFYHYAVGKPEAQYEAQAYYGAMTVAIQSVLSSKDADTQKLLDEAASKVQSENFDKVAVQ
ncbi:ABC transporter substrate-binding protein [Cohnella sp. GCM10020058]|uniref:ABC transporter substrate-binding protein n=1 Tax=Cohnella sp. GCM10020058 TaxID=3317330 RepID=UPI003625B37E